MKLSLLFLVALSIVGCSREASVAPEASTLNWAAGFPKSVPLTIVGGPRPELDAAASSNGGTLQLFACDRDGSCEPSDAGIDDDGSTSAVLVADASIFDNSSILITGGERQHMFCERQAARDGTPGPVVDMGVIPGGGFSCGIYGHGIDEEDRKEIRGVPVWQWKARCELWWKGEYEWPSDSGVVFLDGGRP